MSRILEGNFAVHRAKDLNGKDAVLVVPEPDGEILLLDDSPISFGRVEGGDNPPDSYLTVTYADGDKVHYGPQIVTDKMKN